MQVEPDDAGQSFRDDALAEREAAGSRLGFVHPEGEAHTVTYRGEQRIREGGR